MNTEIIPNLYSAILSIFVAKPESLRGWMEIPFLIGNKAYATDGHALVFFDSGLSSNLPEIEQKVAGDVLAVIPKERPIDFKISVSDILAAMGKAPIVEGFDIKKDTIDCDACNGYGEVDFEFYHEGATYYSEADCPLCEGTGKMEGVTHIPNGKQVPDPETNYSIRGAAFSTSELNRLIRVAELLGENSIRLTYQSSPMGNHIFQIGSVEILQMPLNLSATDPKTIIQIV